MKRGYPEDVLIKHILQIDNITRESLLYPTPTPNHKETRHHMIMTYNPQNPKIIQIIRKHWGMLAYSNSPTKFTQNPMVGYRRLPNMKDQLVSARIKLPEDSNPKYQIPKKNCTKFPCAICRYITKSDKFKSSSTKRTYKTNIPYPLNCSYTNLVYLITCKSCKKQYVGETKRSLETRMKEHLADIKYARDKPVAIHMQQHKSKLIIYQIICLIKSNPDNPRSTTLRKSFEMYWIHQLRTMKPRGINCKEDLH